MTTDAPVPALPTELGAVVAWQVWWDGCPHFAAAVLEEDPETGDPVWFVAGFDDPRSPAVLADQVARFGGARDLTGELQSAQDALAAVRALHVHEPESSACSCGVPWPCPTWSALPAEAPA